MVSYIRYDIETDISSELSGDRMKRTNSWKASLPAALLALSGCANVNPYVAPKSNISTGIAGPADRAKALNDSLNYAIHQGDLWRGKANAVANSQTALYAVALPTSAVAAYYGITGDRGSSAITALTGVSAGAFGLSMLSQSRPRQAIYLAGTNAMACVVWSAAPFAMPQTVYDDVEAKAGTLGASAANVSAAAGDLLNEARLKATSGLPWTDEQKAYIEALAGQSEAAQAHLSGTAEIISSAYGLLSAIDMAATQVTAHTLSIESMVNVQLAAREPSPEAVLQVAREFSGSLKSLQSSLVPPAAPAVPNPAAPAAAAPPSGFVGMAISTTDAQKITAAMTDLSQKQTALNTALRTYDGERATLVGRVAAHSSAVDAAAAIKACKAEGVQPMSITPTNLTPAVKKGSTYEVTINGGSGVFNTRLVGTTGNDVSISYANSPYPSRSPVITFGDKATGSQSVAFADTNDTNTAPIIVTFSIDAAAPPPGKNQPLNSQKNASTLYFVPPPEAFPPTEAGCEAAMPESKAIVFQAAFAGTSDPQKDLSFIDGDWRKETRQAAQAYIYRTIQNPDKTQPAACYLKDLAENDDDFKARLFSDAGILNGSMTKCGAGYDTPQKCWAK